METNLLATLSLTQALDGFRRKDFTAQELTTACLERMEAHAPLNAFITPTPEIALSAAKAADARRSETNLLEGMPLGIKDLFCTKGIRTTAASNILGDFTPPYESTVTQNLLSHGAVFLGKLNLDEFAMGSANITSAFGVVKNPLQAVGEEGFVRVPGGSSGGSAAAVAAGLCLGATGTDTGGSIRQPAAFCGIVGIKPTYGRCSRWGIIAFASSLDQAGPMARTVEDCALLLQAMAGHDPKDSTSAPRPVPDYRALLSRGVKGLTIGIPREYRVEGMPAAIEAQWERGQQILREAGATVVDVSLPHTRYALPCYYIIAPAEASSNLARYDGVRFGARVAAAGDTLDTLYEKTRSKGFGAEVQARILIGTYVLSAGYYDAYYRKAQQVRSLIARDFTDAFQTVDALLTPTTPSEAFKIGENEDDPIKMYLNDVLTVPASLAGLPAMSVPGGTAENGLPLGLQVIGRAFEEDVVLRIGKVLESASF
jgi:aspartyl-tRNA(Asn)/glutamyl-tRNA(Gln) amidotransferase subunit A